ncbi:MAG: 2-C-methyl-D-erythritol 4-phosphate cytidylyltransferase [Desulfovibrionaceae bacterium]|nr:2-C-methyl-D-erythritol 4-phosphate cytidylyltransferase [Desulfovibrionaceae bacterium]MBF0513109.1 2-C-methyl-D-erythritol 4-phosphate cytidylyltransferase [Desulfovibrionaceae bacterium]
MDQPSAYAVILAAGSGSRLAGAGLAVKKQFFEHRGAPLLWHCARAFARVARISGLVFVAPPDELAAVTALLGDLYARENLGLPYQVVAGGERRQDSVLQGLTAVPREVRFVLIHDAARPFVTPKIIEGVVDALMNGSQAVLPMIAVTDTIKRVRGGLVAETPAREELMAAQTPQGFVRQALAKAFSRALAEDWQVTDDASLAERAGVAVSVVAGAPENMKITNPEDLRLLTQDAPPFPMPRVGFGYDVHRYAAPGQTHKSPPRPLKLGGVLIAGAPEVLAHSDGDALLHALADAMLGCLGEGDIGEHFPDSDPAFEAIESGILVSEVLRRFAPARLAIVHVDLTVIAETPRLAPHRHVIRDNVADLLGLALSQVNVKATTEEKLGFTGEKKGLKAVAVVTAVTV